MPEKKRVTVSDIAKLCHVSTATVSRVLSNADYPVSQEVRERVLKAAKEFNYHPNLLGRSLKTNDSRDIGIIIPNLSNYYYTHLISGIMDAAITQDYNITLSSSYRKVEIERKNLIFMLQKQVRGILIVPMEYNSEELKELLSHDVKAVVLEQDSNVDCSKVLFDFEKGIYEATRYLIENGHRKIAYFTAPFRYQSRVKQLEGYKHCLRDYGIPVREDYIVIAETEDDSEQNYEYKNGRRLAYKLMQDVSDMPTAVVCLNDMTAAGAINGFQSKGLHVPDDISVMGFDNIAISEIVSPSITTVDQCIYQMGNMALKMLISSIENPKTKIASVMFQPSIVERQSTKIIK